MQQRHYVSLGGSQGYQRSRDESYRIHPTTEWSQELSGNCHRPHRKWYYLSWSQADCVGS